MKITNVFRELARRAERIQEQNGYTALLKGILGFLVYPFYKRTSYFLYNLPITPVKDNSIVTPRIAPDRLNFRVVTSNREADKLEAEGFSFRKHPTTHNNYLNLYTKWLDCGAIAFCTFLDHEFAAITWVLPTRSAQDAVSAPPQKIDYANGEVMGRGMWVNPEYRGLQLYRYTMNNRDIFLSERGITSLKSTIDYDNRIGKGVHEAVGGRPYGRGRSLKILWWKFWQEECCPEESRGPATRPSAQ